MYYHLRIKDKKKGIEDILNLKVPSLEMNIKWTLRTRNVENIEIQTTEKQILNFEEIKEIQNEIKYICN